MIQHEFQKETGQLANKILAVRDQFDVALLACNGFSGMMGDYIKRLGKGCHFSWKSTCIYGSVFIPKMI